MPAVSVIVPVYNIKTLLPRCVASLQAQTWQDFEVWLVDDGSTDGSGELCDEYAVKDARIHALHKENGGQGSARDLGLDHARGEYICYVDSDDEVLPDLLENALRTAREADADVVVYGYYKQFLDKDGSALRRSGPNLPALSGVYTYEEFWLDFRKAKYESVPWVRFCRRDYLQKYNIRFTSLRVGEDAHFLTQLLDAPFRRIVYLRSAYYIYNIRPSSTMTSFQKAYFSDEARPGGQSSTRWCAAMPRCLGCMTVSSGGKPSVTCWKRPASFPSSGTPCRMWSACSGSGASARGPGRRSGWRRAAGRWRIQAGSGWACAS